MPESKVPTKGEILDRLSAALEESCIHESQVDQALADYGLDATEIAQKGLALISWLSQQEPGGEAEGAMTVAAAGENARAPDPPAAERLVILVAAPGAALTELGTLRLVLADLRQAFGGDGHCPLSLFLEVHELSGRAGPSPEAPLTGPCDLFVGILPPPPVRPRPAWLRESPVYRSWRGQGYPPAFFCQAMPARDAPDDTGEEVLSRGFEALDTLRAESRGRTFGRVFFDAEELSQIAQRELTAWLLGRQLAQAVRRPGARSGPSFAAPVRRDGLETEAICLLWINTRIAPAPEPPPAGQEPLALALRQRIAECVERRGGTWTGGRTGLDLFSFRGEIRCNEAVRTGLLLLEELRPLGVLPAGDRQPLLRVRLVVDDGILDPQGDGELPSMGLGLLGSVDGVGGAGGLDSDDGYASLLITYAVHQSLDTGLRGRFHGVCRYLGTQVWRYDSWPAVPTADEVTVARLVAAVHEHVEYLLRVMEQSQGLAADGGRMDALSVGLDAVYSRLGRVCGLLQEMTEGPDERFWKLSRHIGHILVEEERLWDRLRGLAAGEPDESDLRVLRQVARSKRADAVTRLAELRVRFQALSGFGCRQEDAPPRPVLVWPSSRRHSGLEQKIQLFLEADELEELTAFAALMREKKENVVDFLHEGDEPERSRLAERLWPLADLVLAEDSTEGPQWRRHIFAGLVERPRSDARFHVVRYFLDQPIEPRQPVVERQFRSFGAPGTAADTEILWRCLLVAHVDPAIRGFAANVSPLRTLWTTVAYAKVPIATLAALARRLQSQRAEDQGKIFFDCIRVRVQEGIETAQGRRDLDDLRKLLTLLLYFDFFVESSYFERLEALHSRFQQKATRLRYTTPAVDLGEILQRLTARRIRLGEPEDSLPQGISELPPAVQRHLASQGYYKEWFTCHPDYRIARETLPHLTVENLEIFLRKPSLNGLLLRDLLSRRELFVRPSLLVTALHHPKCSIDFARSHLGRLSRAEVTQIANDRFANRKIRDLAARMPHVPGNRFRREAGLQPG